MEEKLVVSSGNEEQSNEVSASGTQDNGPSGSDTEKVAYDTYAKTLAQEKKAKERLREMEERLKAFEDAEKAREMAEAEKKGEYQKIIESLRKENEAVKNEKEQYQKGLVDSMKLQALVDTIGGKFRHRDYMSFVDTDKIALDPDSGTIDELSLKEYAQEFVSTHKHLIDFGAKKLPNDAPSHSRSLTYDEWLKLPAKEKRERMAEVMATENKRNS